MRFVADKKICRNKHLRAFSLLEILLVVAMITILTGIFAPVFSGLFYRNKLDVAAEKIKTDLSRAQTMAQSAQHDSTWGLYLSPGQSTIFSGTSYAARDISKDERSELPENILIQGSNEIVFTKSSIKPISPASITLKQDTEEKIININSYGLIY